MKSVGERIRQAREWRNMTQAELAVAAGFKHQSAIGNLEGRATGRGGFRLPQIAEALDVPLDWLLNGPDSDTPPSVPRHGAVVEEDPAPYRVLTDLDRAISILRRLPRTALRDALSYLRYLEGKSVPSGDGAGLSVPAPAPRSRN